MEWTAQKNVLASDTPLNLILTGSTGSSGSPPKHKKRMLAATSLISKR